MGRVMQARNSRKYFSDVVIFFSIMLSAFLKNVEPLQLQLFCSSFVLCNGNLRYGIVPEKIDTGSTFVGKGEDPSFS